MKIIVTGSLGHISKPLTAELVQKGHQVTVISSKADRRAAIEGLGATAAIGTVGDVEFLASTFAGADAVYTMIPPGNFQQLNYDIYEQCDQLANNYAEAVRRSGVKRVVHLSSIGAHLATGSGLIRLHYNIERILNGLTDVAITFMRPTAFYYNLFAYIPMIRSTGRIAANYGGDDKTVWVSPVDIAVAVADEITMPFNGKEGPRAGIDEKAMPIAADGAAGSIPARKIRYVASDELTCNEVARILGAAIGKPGLNWDLIPGEQMLKGLEVAGMAPQIASGMVEMYASVHSGILEADYFRNRPAVLGKVKMTDFAREFAAFFNQK